MDIISEPAYTEEKQIRYDVGFVGDIFSFVTKEATADTVTETQGVLIVELFSPRETLRIILANVLWMRITPQVMKRLIVGPPIPPVVPVTPDPPST